MYLCVYSFLKVAVTDMICLTRSKLSESLVHKENFDLRRDAVFKLGDLFCQEG